MSLGKPGIAKRLPLVRKGETFLVEWCNREIISQINGFENLVVRGQTLKDDVQVQHLQC